MCVRLRGTKIGPGTPVAVRQKDGKSVSIWGFNSGDQYNARSERVSSLYKGLERGIIKMESFWEGTGEFVDKGKGDFSIGVLLNSNNEFVVLTREANDTVKPFHHRMPVLLTPEGEERFLNGEFSSDIFLPDDSVTLKM